MRTLVNAVTLCLLMVALSRAAIVHINIPADQQEFLGLGDSITQDFDFNQDAKNDIRFIVAGGRFSVLPLNAEAGISTSYLLGNGFLGTTAVPFLYGAIIERYTEPLGEIPWGITPGGLGYTYLLSYLRETGVGGVWATQEAYLGFGVKTHPTQVGEFDQWQFGWLRIKEFGGFGGIFYEYAYETEVNKSIYAGQIPEPGPAVLTVAAGVFLAANRRRRKPL